MESHGKESSQLYSLFPKMTRTDSETCQVYGGINYLKLYPGYFMAKPSRT